MGWPGLSKEDKERLQLNGGATMQGAIQTIRDTVTRSGREPLLKGGRLRGLGRLYTSRQASSACRGQLGRIT